MAPSTQHLTPTSGLVAKLKVRIFQMRIAGYLEVGDARLGHETVDLDVATVAAFDRLNKGLLHNVATVAGWGMEQTPD